MAEFPYNDEYMTYDFRKHRYVLTEKAVFDELGENLDVVLVNSDPVSRNAFLNKVSRIVYGYIKGNSSSWEYIEYIMAKDGRLRDTIKSMLISQVEYMLGDGAVSNYSGVNLAKGQFLDLYKVRGDAKVSDEVVTEASKILPQYGFCLICHSMGMPKLALCALHKGY